MMSEPLGFMTHDQHRASVTHMNNSGSTWYSLKLESIKHDVIQMEGEEEVAFVVEEV